MTGAAPTYLSPLIDLAGSLGWALGLVAAVQLASLAPLAQGAEPREAAEREASRRHWKFRKGHFLRGVLVLCD